MNDDATTGKVKFIDRKGERFGRLVAINPVPTPGARSMRWACACDCGGAKVVSASGLQSGRTKSCGCLTIEGHAKHRMGKSRTYAIWQNMKQRCDNPRSTPYRYYGGRGISYDPRWSDFMAFLADMGERPPGLQLDRIDNNGNYCKANCRWVTPAENMRNRPQPKRRPIAAIAMLAALGMAMTGCSTTPVAPPVPEVRTVEVRIPVPVPCVSASEVPAVPRTSFKPGGDMKQNAAAADLDLRDLEDYAVRADAVLRQCAGGKP